MSVQQLKIGTTGCQLDGISSAVLTHALPPPSQPSQAPPPPSPSQTLPPAERARPSAAMARNAAIEDGRRFLAPYYLSNALLVVPAYLAMRWWFLHHEETSYSRITTDGLWEKVRESAS